MAELLTIQDSIDGRLDIKSLGEAANGDENTQIVTRTGETYPSAKKAIKTMFANGGLPAQPYPTKTEMENSTLPDGSYAVVTDSTDAVNGLYLKTAGAWVKSKYDPSSFAKSISNGFLLSRTQDVNVDTTAKIIKFTGLMARNKTTYPVSNLTLSYDAVDTGLKTLVFNPTDNMITSVLGSSYAGTKDERFIFGSYFILNGVPIINGIGQYNVNGVLYEKPSYVDDILVVSDVSAINFNFEESKVVLDRTIQIMVKGSRAQITPRTITLPTNRDKSLRYYLVYDTLSGSVISALGDSNLKIQPHQVVLCAYKEDTLSIYGLDEYTLNGVASTEFKRRNGAYHLALFDEGALNIDFNNDKVELFSDIWIPIATGRIKVPAQNVELEIGRNPLSSVRSVLLVDLINSLLVVKQGVTAFKIPPNHILIGAFHERDKKTWGLDRAKINGELPASSGVGEVSHIAFGYDTKKVNMVNVADSYRDTDPVKLPDIDSTMLYSWYDALVAQHPDYITKTLEGNDASGTIPIYSYTFSPPKYTKQGGAYAEIPKVMIQTLHNEQMNFVFPYILMREICNSWQSNEGLESLKWGAEFKVIPTSNPWGLDNNSRTNSNGVDINRNYPAGWVYQTEIPQVNSGPAPLSESESAISYGLMQTWKPHVFLDCHSFGSYKDDGRSVWFTALSDADNEIASNIATPFYSAYLRKYNWLEPYTGFYQIYNIRTKQGTSADASSSLGILGGTLELSWNLRGNAEAEVKGSNIAVNFCVDMTMFYILKNIEYAHNKGL